MPARRVFDRSEFEAGALAAAKGDATIAVVIPARDEESTVGVITGRIHAELVDRTGLVDDVLVVDDASRDGTVARAVAGGARVVSSVGTGKGAAMWTGVAASSASIVVFCDGDLQDFDPAFVTGLCGPLLTDDRTILVKARYTRLLGDQPGEGGRVTELVARPALRLLAPHVAFVSQPLGGEIAARRSVLEQVPFVEGYGVDVALLLDLAARFGVDGIAEVDLGRRQHRNRPLAELSGQAEVVLRTILARAGVAGVEPVSERPPLGVLRGGDRAIAGRVDDVLDRADRRGGVVPRPGRGRSL